jgi:uncharacterized membrane protein
MQTVVPLGRVFFAIALIAWGFQQFLWGDFVPGRAPEWPAALPGRLAWAYLSGAVMMLATLQKQTANADAALNPLLRFARMAAITVGTMIFLWAFTRQVPVAVADTWFGGEWTRLGKALTFFGGAFAIAGSWPPHNRMFIYLGRLCLGLFMILCGIQHFIWVEFVNTLVPTWVPPNAPFWTYFAGVALIAGGAGLIVPTTARLAGLMSGLMVFLWVLMLHIPRAVAAADAGSSRNEWTAVFEALAVSGLAFVLTIPARAPDRALAESAAPTYARGVVT